MKEYYALKKEERESRSAPWPFSSRRHPASGLAQWGDRHRNTQTPQGNGTVSPPEFTNPPLEKRFPMVDFINPAPEKRFPTVDFTHPALEKRFPMMDFINPALEKRFPTVDFTNPPPEK